MILQLIYGLASFAIIMCVIPYIMGSFLCRRFCDITLGGSLVYRYLVGLMSVLALWALMSLAFMMFISDHPFHELRYAYVSILVLLALAAMWDGHREGVRMLDSLSGLKLKFVEYLGKGTERIYVAVFFLILFFQLFNTIYYAPSGYVTDDFYYYACINDNVYMDRLYIKDSHGEISNGPGAMTVGFRMIIATWYAFVSFLSATAHISPLIMCRSVMPAFLINVVYLTVYVFASYCYDGEPRQSRVFMASAAFIMETLSYTYYLFHLIVYVTVWGKQVAGMVGIPILLLTVWAFMEDASAGKRTTCHRALVLFIMSVGIASFSFSSLLPGLAGLFCVMIVALARYRRPDVVMYAFAGGLPFVIQVALYLFLTHRGYVNNY